MNIDKSIELYSRALTLMPGGVNSPVRAFKSVGGTPIFMKKGRGSRLFDEDGNEYVDYCMSWGPLILGHADADVMSAVTGAAKNGTSFGTPNRYEVEIAELVVSSIRSVEKIRFVNSGTEAAMSAVRLARAFTGRKKIIKFDGCYHGHADHLLVAGGSGLATFGVPDSAGVNPDNAKDTIVIPFNDTERLVSALDEHGNDTAAVILEPVPCNYGLIPPDLNFLKKLRDICTERAILLIFDEVITGFRLAWGGAQEYFGIDADITVLGKIIGGGLPVGAYGGRNEIMAMVSPDGPMYQAGTLSGNPIAMAAGLSTLKKIFSQKTYGLLDEKAVRLGVLMKPALMKHAGKILFLQCGSIFAVYFSDLAEIKNLNDVKKSDMKLFAKFHGEMLKRGIYLSPSGYEVGFISTAHTDDDFKKTAAAAEESLDILFG